MQWGKVNRHIIGTVDLEQLMQMAPFDCEDTLYKFRGKADRHKLGVLMGGYNAMSLALAVIS